MTVQKWKPNTLGERLKNLCCVLGYLVQTELSLNATEQNLPTLNLAGLTIRSPCYKDFDVLVILSVAFGFEAPSTKLCYEISLLSLPVSRRERLLSLGPILCRGLANGPANQHGSKNLILGFNCGYSYGVRKGLWRHGMYKCLYLHNKAFNQSSKYAFYSSTFNFSFV